MLTRHLGVRDERILALLVLVIVMVIGNVPADRP
jgi:hypothetical protein